MKIKRVIELDVRRKKGTVICRDLPTLQLIMGTRGIAGNYHHYGVEKKGSEFHVSLDTLKERIKKLEFRKDKLEKSLEIIKQVVRVRKK